MEVKAYEKNSQQNIMKRLKGPFITNPGNLCTH